MYKAIEIVGLSKSYGSLHRQKIALHNLSLNVAKGEAFGFLGPNGAGKSTTIKLLLGFLRANGGTMTVMGNMIGRDEFRDSIGYLPEFPFFYDHLTAKETLLLSGRLSGMRKTTIAKRIGLLLERLGLVEAINQRVGGFSKGMKQRLGMANALIHDPEILILDEPMSGLDPLGRHLIKNIVMELRQQQKTIFFSSHILSDIEALCDRIAVIHRGNLLFTGSLADFLEGEDDLERRFVSVIREADDEQIA